MLSVRRFVVQEGATVGKYRIKKKLGEGGMSCVYLADDLANSRLVAMKFLERDKVLAEEDPEVRRNLRKRFIREANTAAKISHPNIIQVYDSDFEAQDWFIAMEFFEGTTIRQAIESGKHFSADEIVNVLYQVIESLQFAWENFQVIHRDINPQNLMIDQSNVVKIVDLGLAKPMNVKEFNNSSHKLTLPGTPLGTPYYMAPEQTVGKTDIDYRADIYGIGATLYEVCTGKRAFMAKTTFGVYKAKLKKDFEPIKNVRNDLPEALVELFSKMLEPEPDDRVESYSAVIDVLYQICDVS